MFVRCSNCQTQFSLDDQQIGAEGAAVRCAVCRYVFRVEAPEDVVAPLWLVRTVDGDAFEADDLGTLRTWIREGRLHPDDTISRTGEHWIRLGDMPEFSDAFAGFPGLQPVLSATRSPANQQLDLGPPPSFAGEDEDEGHEPEEDAPLEGLPSEPSARIDLSGLLGREPGAVEEDALTEVAVPQRRSMFDDESKPISLEDHSPARPSKKKKKKHQTKKVRTVASLEQIDPDGSGVLRVLDVDPDAALPEPIEQIEEVDATEIDADDVEEIDADDLVSDDGAPRSGAHELTSGSMLGAVTAHVQPLQPLPAKSGPIEVAEPEPAASSPKLSRAVEADPREGKRRASWPLFAGLGLLCGAAIIFGIPPVRGKVLAMAGLVAGTPQADDVQELAEVDAAVTRGTQAELGTVIEAARARASDAELSTRARADLGLAAVEAQATRALALRIQAANEGPSSDTAFRAADEAEIAAQAFAGIDVASASPQRLARTRARLRLAQERPEDEVLPLVPATEPELHALVTGASLWAGEQSRVPSGVISKLASLQAPSVTAQIVLAMAYARSGDEVGAAATREALRERAPDDPGVKALLAAAKEDPADTPPAASESESTPAAESGDVPQGQDEPEVEETPPEDEETIIVSEGGGGGGMSIDKLVERGCEKVESGNAKEGLKLLLKAFDRRPNDLDVLVCLGLANHKRGSADAALRYYKRALSRSPKFMPALLGAARAAKKAGESSQALAFYRRVLEGSPSNAEAKSFIAKQSSADAKPEPAPAKPEPTPAEPEPTKPVKPAPPGGSAKPAPAKPSVPPAPDPESP